MSDLLLPSGTIPSNLHLAEGTRTKLVTNDLFHIADRIREISDKLFILELQKETAEGDKFGLAIMEHTTNHGDMLVFRVPIQELDSRVLDRLKYIFTVPLHVRLAILDKERDKWEAEQHENEMEKLWDQMGAPMQWQLEHDGFIEYRGVSYRKMNHTAQRAGRRM